MENFTSLTIYMHRIGAKPDKTRKRNGRVDNVGRLTSLSAVFQSHQDDGKVKRSSLPWRKTISDRSRCNLGRAFVLGMLKPVKKRHELMPDTYLPRQSAQADLCLRCLYVIMSPLYDALTKRDNSYAISLLKELYAIWVISLYGKLELKQHKITTKVTMDKNKTANLVILNSIVTSVTDNAWSVKRRRWKKLEISSKRHSLEDIWGARWPSGNALDYQSRGRRLYTPVFRMRLKTEVPISESLTLN